MKKIFPLNEIFFNAPEALDIILKNNFPDNKFEIVLSHPNYVEIEVDFIENPVSVIKSEKNYGIKIGKKGLFELQPKVKTSTRGLVKT